MDRTTALQQTTTGATYRYRADGMRCQKVEGITINANLDNNNEVSGYDDVWASNKPTWRFFYDGQTPVADDHTYAVGNVIHIDRTAYVPGPRGIDCVDNWTGLPYVLQSTQYPFYDCHGNNPSASLRAGCGSVSRSGSGSYSLGGERVYDAWGISAWTGNDSQQRYCANLGHRRDDETGTYTGGSPDGDGLAHMRARYYEPGTGRFVSEDPAKDGWNWYDYSGNDPVDNVDESGQSSRLAGARWLAGWAFAAAAYVFAEIGPSALASLGCAIVAIYCFGSALNCCTETFHCYDEIGRIQLNGGASFVNGITSGPLLGILLVMIGGAAIGKWSEASIAVSASFAYGLLCVAALWCEDMCESNFRDGGT